MSQKKTGDYLHLKSYPRSGDECVALVRASLAKPSGPELLNDQSVAYASIIHPDDILGELENC